MKKAQRIFNVSMVLALCVVSCGVYYNNPGTAYFGLAWILVDTLAFMRYIKTNKPKRDDLLDD